MNEVLVSRYLNDNIISINDLTTSLFMEYRDHFIKKYDELIRKYLSYYDRLVLDSPFSFFNIFNIKEAFVKNIQFTKTRVKIGKRGVLIPIQLDVIIETIFSNDMNHAGLFRRSAAINDIKKLISDLNNEIEKGGSRNRINQIISGYDIILYTVVFKKLFDSYNIIFPEKYFPILLKIARIEDFGEKIILTKMAIISLPFSNRFLLDVIVKFFTCIHFIATDKGTDYTENMDIRGFAVVMTPKLFFRERVDVNMEEMNLLIDWLTFIFQNYKKIFNIEKFKISNDEQ